MSNHVIREDRIVVDDHKHQPKSIVDVKSSNLSERIISDVQTTPLRKIRSENRIESYTNYDDLCGPWAYPKNPFYSRYFHPPRPSLCIWKYFTQVDITYIKRYQENQNIIQSFFEHKLQNKIVGDPNFLKKLLWECLKFTRLNLFTEKSISACLGIMYLTHSFFLSCPWETTEEIYQFFYKTVLLHVVSVCTLSVDNIITILIVSYGW